MKKVDDKDIKVVKKKKKNENENYTDDEGDYRPLRPMGPLDQLFEKAEKGENMTNEQITQFVAEAGGIDVGPEDSIYSSSGCVSEQLNVVAITDAFANAYIPLPDRIKNIKSCINIKTTDDKCFLYCHLLNRAVSTQ